MLSGGGIYYKEKQKSIELYGPIVIQGTKLESTDEHKKKFSIKVTLGDTVDVIAFESEEMRAEWLEALTGNLDKDVGMGDRSMSKKSQSTSMRLKKKAGSSVATSSAGKSLIKEFLGKDGIRMIDIVKKVITIHENKKKAIEVENNIIRVAVKVILLWKNKDLTTQDIAATVPKVKALWSDVIDCCEMSFAYDPAKIKETGVDLSVAFTELLKANVTEKTLLRMTSTIAYITDKEVLDVLFAATEQEDLKKELMRILRGGWIAAFKDDKR